MATRAACTISKAVSLLLVLIATLATVTRSAWVGDYSSGIACGSTIPVEQCDPQDATANSACRDVCHYGGCRRGGRCVTLEPDGRRGCQCQC